MYATIAPSLTALGVPPRLAEVYCFVAEQGEVVARDVAETFSYTRSTAHDVLSALVRYGFARSVTRGKEKIFCMESPEVISDAFIAERRKVEMRSDAFEQMLPILRTLHARANRQTGVRYFTGKEEVVAVLETLREEETVRFTDDVMFQEDFGHDRTIVVTQRTTSDGVRVRTISPSLISMSGQTIIAEDRVVFLPGGDTPVAVEICCQSIAGMCKFAFELSWRAAGEWGGSKME